MYSTCTKTQNTIILNHRYCGSDYNWKLDMMFCLLLSTYVAYSHVGRNRMDGGFNKDTTGTIFPIKRRNMVYVYFGTLTMLLSM